MINGSTILAAWFVLISAISYVCNIVFRADLINVLRLLMLGTVFVLSFFYFSKKRTKQNIFPLTGTIFFFIFMLGGLLATLVSDYPEAGVSFFIGLALAAFLLMWHIKYLSAEGVRKVYAVCAFLGTIMIAVFIFFFRSALSFELASSTQRLGVESEVNANSIGQYCLAVIIVSQAYKSIKLRVAGTVLAAIPLILSWSRTSLIAACVGVLTANLLMVLKNSRKMFLAIILSILTVSFVCFFWKDDLNFFFNSVILRGKEIEKLDVNMMLAGRPEVWQKTMMIFDSGSFFQKLMGQGFFTRAFLRQDLMVASTHNGFLSMLLETGVVGVGCVILWLVLCLKRAIKKYNEQNLNSETLTAVSVTIGIIMTVLVYSLTESLLINPSNLLGLLFLTALFWSSSKALQNSNTNKIAEK